MITRSAFFIAGIAFCAAGIATGSGRAQVDSYLSDERRSVIMRAQEDLLNDRFDPALTLFDSLKHEHPSDPLGCLFEAATLLAMMTDAEHNSHPERFVRLIDSTHLLADRSLDSAAGRTAAWMHLLKGHAFAYRSLWESRFGSLATAIDQGFDAREAYLAGLAADSSLYDLYGGLGMFHYWKSSKAGVLRWLGIMKDESEQGIKELYLTIDSSLVSARAARQALIWIYLDRKEFDSVLAISHEMLGKYPDGKLFLWPIAEAFYRTRQYDSALVYYTLLRERLVADPGNCDNLIQVDCFRFRCLRKLERREEASQVALAMKNYSINLSRDIRWKRRAELRYVSNSSGMRW